MIDALVNGVPATSLSLEERALHYGDGLFETLAIREGRPEFWEEHLRRLRSGCEHLGFPAPDSPLLESEARQLCGERERGVLKIIVSRGTGGRGYRPPERANPTRILSLHPWPEWPESHQTQGVEARICSTPLACNPALAGIKHLNRLEQVLARAEWGDPAIAEGIMLSTDGHLVEGTMSNLFLVRDGRLLTPDLSRCGVAGIMREKVMESACRLGIECETLFLGLEELEKAEGVFLTNSLIGIWPVRRIGVLEYRFPNETILKIQMDIEKTRSGSSS